MSSYQLWVANGFQVMIIFKPPRLRLLLNFYRVKYFWLESRHVRRSDLVIRRAYISELSGETYARACDLKRLYNNLITSE